VIFVLSKSDDFGGRTDGRMSCTKTIPTSRYSIRGGGGITMPRHDMQDLFIYYTVSPKIVHQTHGDS